MQIFPIIFLIVAITLVLAFFAAYFLLFKKENPVADVYERETVALSYTRRRYPM